MVLPKCMEATIPANGYIQSPEIESSRSVSVMSIDGFEFSRATGIPSSGRFQVVDGGLFFAPSDSGKRVEIVFFVMRLIDPSSLEKIIDHFSEPLFDVIFSKE